MSNYKLPKDIKEGAKTFHWSHLKYAQYSQACVLEASDTISNYRVYVLFSYDTPIMAVNNRGFVYITDDVNYSVTTARHVNRFCKQINELLGTALTYQWCKQRRRSMVNISTEKVIYTRDFKGDGAEQDYWIDLYRECLGNIK